MRKIDEIILHCTDTDENVNVENITKYHVEINGWRDIGYHYLIDYKCIWHTGRPIRLAGSHCYGYNANSIGIAYIGRKATQKMIIAMANFCNNLVDQYEVKKISLHCEYNDMKTCPNFSRRDIILFNNYSKLKLVVP